MSRAGGWGSNRHISAGPGSRAGCRAAQAPGTPAPVTPKEFGYEEAFMLD